MDKLGGRKFVFAVVLTALSFILVLTKSLSAKEWIIFASGLGAVYVVGNLTDHQINKE